MSHLVFVATTRIGIQALEAAKRLGHHVTLVTSHKDRSLLNDADRAAIERCTDEVVHCADAQDADAVQAVLEACLRHHPVDGVLTTFELFATSTAVAADRLGLRATNLQGVLNARDKGRCREIMAAAGIPSVRYRVVRTAQEACNALSEIGYPAIIKPTTASGKALTFVANDEADVLAHFARHQADLGALNDALRAQVAQSFVVEEIAHGALYSIELGVDSYGDWCPLAISRRQTAKHNPIVEMGSYVPSGLSDAQYDEVAAYAIRVSKALDLRLGIFHVEFIYTADGPRLVEVNPRVAGGPLPELVRDVTGVDMFEILVRIHLGEHAGYDKLPCTIASGHTFVGALDDAVVRADLPPDWFAPIRARMHSGFVNIQAGQHVRAMKGNFDILGVLAVIADSYEHVVAEAERLLGDVELALGIALAQNDDETA